MRQQLKFLRSGIVILALAAASPAFAQDATAPAADTPPAPSLQKVLSTRSSIKDLTTDPKGEDALMKHIPKVAAFLLSGQAEALIPSSTTLEELAEIPQAQAAGLTADALKKINEDLAR